MFYAKRFFDVLLGTFMLLVLMPLNILIFLTIKIECQGPVFFVQSRIGRNAKPFQIIKFRTMRVNHGGNTISVKGESRITPLGAVLRRFKLDELPELCNILKGDMSFVGPRPDVPGYADKLTGDDRLLLIIRPGLTGATSLKYYNEEELLAGQPDPVKYNDEVLYPDKVQIDNNYVKNWSFWLDIKIILFTLMKKKLTEEWAK